MFLAKRHSRMAGLGEISTADVQAYIAAVFEAELGRAPREQGLEFYTTAVLQNGMTPEQIREEIVKNAAPEIAWRTAAALGTEIPDATDYQASVWTAAATDSIPEPLADWGVAVPATTTTATVVRTTVPDNRTASAAQIAAAEAAQIYTQSQGVTTQNLLPGTATTEDIDLPPVSKPVLIGGLLLLVLALKK